MGQRSNKTTAQWSVADGREESELPHDYSRSKTCVAVDRGGGRLEEGSDSMSAPHDSRTE